MTKAIIYRPCKNPMQSGEGNTKFWVLKFEKKSAQMVDNLIGWQGSEDMDQEIKLKFKSKEAALEYAKGEGLDFEVIDPKPRKIRIKSYADNFTN